MKIKPVKNSIAIIIFLAPALSFYLIFYFMPVVLGVGLSLFEWNGLDPNIKFVGLQNYRTMFSDPLFWNSLKINLEAVVISLGTQLPLALFLAALLMQSGFGMRVFRVLLFIPQMLSLVAVGMLWKMIYQPTNGLANQLLLVLGSHRVDWLGQPQNALMSLLLTSLWTYFGFHMVLQTAGMASIPKEIYEAASLETNNKLLVFFRITLPLLKETLLISTVMIITGSFAFLMGLFWIMTAGGPIHGTELLGIRMYVEAFRSYRIGYSSTIAMFILVLIAIVVTLLLKWNSKNKVEF